MILSKIRVVIFLGSLTSLVLVIFKFCKLSKKQLMLEELEIHVHSTVFQDKYLIALKRHDLLSGRIYKVYTRYIPGKYYVYTMPRSLASPLPQTGTQSDLLGFGYREAVVIKYIYDIINIYLSYQHILYGISKKLESIFSSSLYP